MSVWVSVIEWFDDEENMPIDRKIFGPFPSQEEAGIFGEEYLSTEQISEQFDLDCSVGWSTEELFPAK